MVSMVVSLFSSRTLAIIMPVTTTLLALTPHAAINLARAYPHGEIKYHMLLLCRFHPETKIIKTLIFQDKNDTL
jgi:hypothetical protein